MENISQPYYPQDQFHSQNVAHTLAELEKAVQQHEATLNQLRRDVVPPQFPSEEAAEAASIEVMTAAYNDLAKAEPYLPSTHSVLPALLAMRKTQETIAESQAYLDAQTVSLDQTRKRIEIERANLADQKALAVELEKRRDTLRQQLQSGNVLSAEDRLKKRVRELEQQGKQYDTDRRKLMTDLRQFIQEQLGKQLALEKAGGAIVGDVMDVDSDNERSQKLKKRKRQKGRNDEDDEANEQLTAADELQKLVEDLLTASAEQPQAYVAIPRGSTTAAFLVRSKVAQFHPQDSTKLRLLNFGRGFDD